MSEFGLSSQQIQVIDALSSGATMLDAAQQAGVHRNTISNWRRNQQIFRDALSDAHYDRALLVREQYEGLLGRAFETLDQLLADPKTPASVRLKAALAIIEKASTPPPPQNLAVVKVNDEVHNLHKDAQPNAQADVEPPAPIVHNSAQTPYRREGPKVGRNEPCPCGSGAKYKRCCLDKESTRPLAKAA